MREGPLRFARHSPPAVVALDVWIVMDAMDNIKDLPALTLVYIGWH